MMGWTCGWPQSMHRSSRVRLSSCHLVLTSLYPHAFKIPVKLEGMDGRLVVWAASASVQVSSGKAHILHAQMRRKVATGPRSSLFLS